MPLRERAHKYLDARVRMDRKQRSKVVQATYALDQTMMGRAFGQLRDREGWIVSCCVGWKR